MISDEIVKALRHCSNHNGSNCYSRPVKDHNFCATALREEAADLIERLEKEKVALISAISGFCQWCKNLDADENSCRVWVGCSICDRKCPCAGCQDGSKWEWKGADSE